MKNKIRASKLFFDAKIFKFSKWLSDNDRYAKVVEEIKKFNTYNAKDPIFNLAAHQLLPSRFIPVYDKNVEYYELIDCRKLLSHDNYIYWLLGLFINKRDILKSFIIKRKAINKNILNGEFLQALSLLDKLDESCKSWWSIQLRLHIYKEFKIGDTRQFLDELPMKFLRADLSNKVNDLRLISESSSIGIFTNEFMARMNEYRSSGVVSAIEYGAIESCRYLPINFDNEREVSLSIICKDAFESLIDQYVIFKEIILEMPPELIDIDIKNKIFYISDQINDDELKSIFRTDIQPKESINNIIKLYTNGQYEIVIDKIEGLVSQSDGEFFGLIDVYARSKIYTNKLYEAKTYFELLANDLANILQCDKNTLEKLDNLERVIVKFKLESWAKSLNFHVVSALEEVHDLQTIELVRNQTRVLGELNTPKAMLKDYKYTAFTEFEPGTPVHRLMKYGHGAKKAQVDRALFPIISDFVRLQSHRFIESEMYEDAINFCIDEYLNNNVSAIYLPLKKLCYLIESIDKSSNGIYISCLVIYDIMSRAINDNFEEAKGDLFEELMDNNNSHRPSAVFAKNEYNQYEKYFLNYICIPSQLDNFTDYVSNDDVIHERIAILDLLINSSPDHSESLKNEKDSVLETLFSEKLRAKLESGKLYVDVQSLISKRKHMYNMLFDQAKEIKGGVLLSPLEEDVNLNSEDIFHLAKGNAVASSRKMELLFTIFKTIVSDFTLNENFGLDKYLSAEIRHIVFTTQLRSCFEKTKLVTIKKDGVYLSSLFWKDKYKYVNSSLVNEIDDLLKSFSEEIDLTLSEVNENFRVETSGNNPQHVFNYVAYHHRLVRVSQIIMHSTNSEDFIKKIIDYMWEITAENARLAQNIINDYLAIKINESLDKLEYSIQSAKRDAVFVDLMQEIKNARTLFTNEIELVLNWFRFVGSDDNKNFERLNVVNEATLSSFESVYGHKYARPTFIQSKTDVFLNYRESRSLFIAIFTALENSCKYGDPSKNAMIEHIHFEKVSKIQISNELFEIDSNEAFKLIEREKNKWNDNNSDLSFKEGGSGLYKIYSILNNASEGFAFNISTSNNRFYATIEMKNEYFSDRR